NPGHEGGRATSRRRGGALPARPARACWRRQGLRAVNRLDKVRAYLAFGQPDGAKLAPHLVLETPSHLRRRLLMIRIRGLYDEANTDVHHIALAAFPNA